MKKQSVAQLFFQLLWKYNNIQKLKISYKAKKYLTRNNIILSAFLLEQVQSNHSRFIYPSKI